MPLVDACGTSCVPRADNEGLLHTKRTLERVGIGAVRVKGKSSAKALQSFLDELSVRVCLLHTAQDAAGLNLVVALCLVYHGVCGALVITTPRAKEGWE